MTQLKAWTQLSRSLFPLQQVLLFVAEKWLTADSYTLPDPCLAGYYNSYPAQGIPDIPDATMAFNEIDLAALMQSKIALIPVNWKRQAQDGWHHVGCMLITTLSPG